MISLIGTLIGFGSSIVPEVLVQLRAEQDVTNKQITSLWDLFNKLRERVH